MQILVTGATGFIASQIVTDLIAAGHQVTCCVRNTTYAKCLFPNATIVACNFIKDTSSSVWVERLKNIDVVINCVGILYHPKKEVIWAVHNGTPRALFDACVQVGVKKVIQLSALGVETVDVDYANSKKAADDYLQALPISSVIVRPSVVYAKGSYGGTSLFRGLAGLPYIMPLPGGGRQEFQPIHLKDISRTFLRLVEMPQTESFVLNATGPNRLTLNSMLTTLRSWLGFTKPTIISIPLWLIRLASYFGDLIPYSTLNATSYKMMQQNNITTEIEQKKFIDMVGFAPRDYISGLYSEPSTVQDHWHARLYFLKPLLQVTIAFVWFFSGINALFLYPKMDSYSLFALAGVSDFWLPIALYASCALDIALGIAMLCNYQLKKLCLLQIAVVIFYTAVITLKLPYLWLDPFGPVIKNIPFIVTILIFLALESDR